MRIKEFFVVPEGTKVTEKVFGKVLLSTILSIFLCTVCLTSTTWAWFVVGIENQGNEIRVATVTSNVTMMKKGATDGTGMVGETDDGGYDLAAGTYEIHTELYNEGETPVYLVISVTQNGTTLYYSIPFGTGNSTVIKDLEIVGANAQVSITKSWVNPAGATAFDSAAVVIAVPEPEPSTEPVQTETP